MACRSPLASFSSPAELRIYPPDWPNRTTGGVEQFSVCDCHVGSDLLVACGPSSDAAGSAKITEMHCGRKRENTNRNYEQYYAPERNGVKRQLKDVAVLFSSWFIIASSRAKQYLILSPTPPILIDTNIQKSHGASSLFTIQQPAPRAIRNRNSKFDDNIKKRGHVPIGKAAEHTDESHLSKTLIAFFLFVVVGSSIVQVLRMFQTSVPNFE